MRSLHSSVFPRSGFVALAIGIAALGGISGCNNNAAATNELPAPKVTLVEVVSQETVDADEYTGKTEASESVEVRSRVFGYLKSIDFADGDFVKQDQVLFTIEPDEYEAIHQQSLSRIDLNKANLELAKTKLARNENLVKSGAVSREDYDESVAAVQAAEASITAAKADANRTAVDLKYTVIKSPIDGRIDRTYVTKGNLLTGGQASGTLLTKIVKEQPMYAYFDVDERSLLRYMRQRDQKAQSKPGSLRTLKMPCYLQLADEKEFLHEGQLDFASNEVKTGTGTARIRGIFANEKREIASGMFVRIRIPVSEPYKALFIPERSLATDQSIKFVYVVGSNNTAERRAVELGGQRGDLRIIKSGLKERERVIVKGLQRVKPDQKVEPEMEPAPKVAKPTPDKVSTESEESESSEKAPASPENTPASPEKSPDPKSDSKKQEP